jgi:hypothetical protein
MEHIDKKKLEKVLKQLKKTKKCMKDLNKTIKNTAAVKRCSNFCKNDYVAELNRMEKESLKKYNIKPTKESNRQKFKSCKRIFCNEGCQCYDSPYDKATISKGFQKGYSAKKIAEFRKRGALSACLDTDYDVFHN